MPADTKIDVRDVDNEELAEPTSEDFSYLQQIKSDIRSAFLNGSSKSTADIPYDVREYDNRLNSTGVTTG